MVNVSDNRITTRLDILLRLQAFDILPNKVPMAESKESPKTTTLLTRLASTAIPTSATPGLLTLQMGFRKRVWNWLKKRIPFRRRSRRQARLSDRSEDPYPLPVTLRPEPPVIAVTVSYGESTTPITEGVHLPPRNGEEGSRYAQVPTPVASQAVLPQLGPSSPSFYPENPTIVATAPFEQPATPLIQGIESYRRDTGQLSGTTSTPHLANVRLEASTLVASQAGPWTSSNQDHRLQIGDGGILSGAHNFSVGQMNAVETQSIGILGIGTQNVVTQNVHNHAGTSLLKDMLLYVIPGAEFNSAARDPPPKCHPDTRVQIRQDLQNQINSEARLI
ncbi:hypothetical protein P691DRAFT_764918 [Macrolepiota fuliginosa MF-IS2]|uniref:Uncharacterized protein n=1 Tax=Macrolepiota fuliginosa MF-IS2 TaxID=1400762 RepID=A0A9P6BWC4_9AGAR|nr:hypothetical protein P691DRAFT_764918 [Macrolepiota fuliginosa MF-IS2]